MDRGVEMLRIGAIDDLSHPANRFGPVFEIAPEHL
jgi:hypothetical protein